MNTLENEPHGQVNGTHATNWGQLCETAGRETDPAKLLLLLAGIENRIFVRLQELGATALEERANIEKAIAKMRQMQVEKLNFPKIGNGS